MKNITCEDLFALKHTKQPTSTVYESPAGSTPYEPAWAVDKDDPDAWTKYVKEPATFKGRIGNDEYVIAYERVNKWGRSTYCGQVGEFPYHEYTRIHVSVVEINNRFEYPFKIEGLENAIQEFLEKSENK